MSGKLGKRCSTAGALLLLIATARICPAAPTELAAASSAGTRRDMWTAYHLARRGNARERRQRVALRLARLQLARKGIRCTAKLNAIAKRWTLLLAANRFMPQLETTGTQQLNPAWYIPLSAIQRALEHDARWKHSEFLERRSVSHYALITETDDSVCAAAEVNRSVGEGQPKNVLPYCGSFSGSSSRVQAFLPGQGHGHPRNGAARDR
jgi:hypothetical protein